MQSCTEWNDLPCPLQPVCIQLADNTAIAAHHSPEDRYEQTSALATGLEECHQHQEHCMILS
jgi:hypothetical protein